MTITNTQTLKPLNTATPAGPARGPRRSSGFSLREPSAEESVAATTSPDAVSLGSLLAAQEYDPDSPRDRAARRHGQRMLDLLRDLQRAFLDAGNPGAPGTSPALSQLADLAEDIPEADNPRLALVLRAVAVRAAVELARRGMTQSEQTARPSIPA